MHAAGKCVLNKQQQKDKEGNEENGKRIRKKYRMVAIIMAIGHAGIKIACPIINCNLSHYLRLV